MKQNSSFLRIIFFMLILSAVGTMPLCAQYGGIQMEANPASDFGYDLNETGDGVVITDYRGGYGGIVIPAEIEGYPVVEWNVKIYGDANITALIFPDSITKIVNPTTTDYRGERRGAFSYMYQLEKVRLPKYLKEIPADWFSGHKFLTEVQLPDLEVIGAETFIGTSIEKLIIPQSVKKIEAAAFSGCQQLTELTLPDTLEYIGAEAFSGTSIGILNIPQSVKRIEAGAFRGCGYLRTLTIANGVEYIGPEAFKDTGIRHLIIPPSVTRIEKETFSGWQTLQTVSIPDSIESIGQEAFRGAAIKMLTIPKSVQRIGAGAFSNCESLETLIISDGIEYIGSGAFKNCTNLTNVTLPTKQIEYKGTEDGSTFNAFYNCPRISLKDRKKIKETGYTGTFTFD